MKKIIAPDNLHRPFGYAHAIQIEKTLYISGQVPVDPETGEFKLGSFREQAKLTFDNVTTLLEAAGTSWENAVKVGVYLTDLKNFGEMNEVYEQYLAKPYPARTTIQVGLPPNVAIEVDCIAVVP